MIDIAGRLVGREFGFANDSFLRARRRRGGAGDHNDDADDCGLEVKYIHRLSEEMTQIRHRFKLGNPFKNNLLGSVSHVLPLHIVQSTNTSALPESFVHFFYALLIKISTICVVRG